MFDLNELLTVAKDRDTINRLLTEAARKEIMQWINVKALPTLRDTVNEFNYELKEKALGETGWIRIRDSFFIPTVLSIVVWIFMKLGEIIQQETENK